MLERLDHFFCNQSWETLGMFYTVSHLVNWTCDHCPVFLRIQNSVCNIHEKTRAASFRYEVFWKEYARCRTLFSSVGNVVGLMGKQFHSSVGLFKIKAANTNRELGKWSRVGLSLRAGRGNLTVRLSNRAICNNRWLILWLKLNTDVGY